MKILTMLVTLFIIALIILFSTANIWIVIWALNVIGFHLSYSFHTFMGVGVLVTTVIFRGIFPTPTEVLALLTKLSKAI